MLSRVSKVEETDLIIAWLAIAAIFSMPSIIHGFSDVVGVIKTVCIALVTVGIGFILHEMAHKFTAIKYGCWSEFRKDGKMLLIGLVVSVFGVCFAAPGAAYARGNLNRDQIGWVKVAGVLVNLILCIPFGLLFLYGKFIDPSSILSVIGISGVTVNAFLALFNMIPIEPLDGANVSKWNIKIYLGVIAASLVILAFVYGVIPV